MENKSRILRSILYVAAGLVVLFFAARDPGVMVLVGLLASACWLAAVAHWDKVAYLPLILGVGIVFWRTNSVLLALIMMAVIGAVIYGSRACMIKKQPLSTAIGVPALAAAVAAVLMLSGYLYVTRGAFDFSGLLPSLSQIKASIDEVMYEPLLAAAQTTQMTPEEIDQAISAVLTTKNIYLDAMFMVLPGVMMGFLFIFSWIAQKLGRLLVGNKKEELLPSESLRKLKLPRGIGIVFLVAFILSFFVEGTLGAVLNNLVTALELPLLLCGCFTTYTLFTRRATTRGSRVLTATLVILTAIGIPLSLSVAYVFVGAFDSIGDLRRRIRGEGVPQEENERMKQWNRLQEMKPGNDAEASEELDVSDDDDDDNKGEDQ